MKNQLLIFLVTIAAIRLIAAELPEGKALFNGHEPQRLDADGRWQVLRDERSDCAEGGKGWLRTDRAFTNFVLEVEWRGLETNYNSGIFVRAPLDGNPWATNVWQINLKQSAIGELLEGSMKIVPVNMPKLPAGEWIKFHIEARGAELTLDVNGQRARKFSQFTPSSGYIGLQAEGKMFEFRGLRITELP